MILAALEAIVARLQPAAPAFHRSPARSNINNLIDFKIEPGKGIYKESLKGEAHKYDLSKLGLMPFTHSIKAAAQHLRCSIGPASVCHFTPADGQPAVNIIHQRSSNVQFRTSMYGNRSLMSHRLTSTYDATPNV